MPTQTRTFQLRLPKGAHEGVLDAWGALSGRAMRVLHARVRKAEAAHRDGDGAVRDPDGLRQARNTIKSQMLAEFEISGRQYNGIEAQLKGVVESRRACAALDAGRLAEKLSTKTQQLGAITKRLADDGKARAEHQAAVDRHIARLASKKPTLSARAHAVSMSTKPPPRPTKAQAAKMLDESKRERLLFDARAKEKSIASLTTKLTAAQTIASGRVDPSIVFGGKSLLQQRNRIHPNDAQSLASWRSAWDDARSAGFMLMGGKDEAAGNKSCKMFLEVKVQNTVAEAKAATPATPLSADASASVVLLDVLPKPSPTVALHLRLPDALINAGAMASASPVGKHLLIKGVALPTFGRDTLLGAIARNAGPVSKRGQHNADTDGENPEGLALTYRFVRDAGFKHATLSPWRVCITVEDEVPEIRPGMARVSGAKVAQRQLAKPTPEDVWSLDCVSDPPARGAPSEDASVGKRLGVDVNADCLALALISTDGNLLKTWTFPLHLRGLTSGQREAKIGDVVKQVVDLAVAHNARIVLEKLDFAAKKREMGMEAARSLGEAGYRRMLSSLAYAAIGTGITRRAARHGVSVGFVNPAYTSLIGAINWMRRVGHKTLTRHEAAACAIARRDAGFSERINAIHGRRGRRTTVPAPEEARRHVWRQWARVHRERLAAAKARRKEKAEMEMSGTGSGRPAHHPSPSAHPPGRGEGRRAERANTNPGPGGGAPPPVALGVTVRVLQGI